MFQWFKKIRERTRRHDAAVGWRAGYRAAAVQLLQGGPTGLPPLETSSDAYRVGFCAGWNEALKDFNARLEVERVAEQADLLAVVRLRAAFQRVGLDFSVDNGSSQVLTMRDQVSGEVYQISCADGKAVVFQQQVENPPT